MSWRIIGPGQNFDDRSGSSPWYIKFQQSVRIPPCREMAIHEELVIDGELVIENDAKLELQQ